MNIYKITPSMQFVILLQLLLLCSTVVAQRTTYKNAKFTWDKEFSITDAVKPKYANEDVVILSQETEYKIKERTQALTGRSVDFRYRSSSIKKHFIAKIQTQKGLEELSKITLPESINHYTDDYNGLVSRQVFFNDLKHYNVEVQYFAARILKPDGSQQRVPVKDEIKTEKMGRLGQNHKIIEFVFELQKLEVGSVVEIEYELFIPQPLGWAIIPEFNEQMAGFYTSPGFYYSWRLFFNEKYPIQKSKTTFTCFNELRTEWQFYNGATPTDTINDETVNKYVWEFEDLPASNFELNEHAHKEQPHVYFYFHNLLYGEWNDTQIREFKPYTWDFLCRDVIQFKGDNEVVSSQFSLKERMLSQFYDKHKNLHEKPIQILKSMHEDLVKNFAYFTNEKRYFGRDLLLYGAGRDMKDETIHEVNRFGIYDGLLRRLQQPYYLVYVPDKRVASIEEERVIAPINPIIFYAVQFGDRLIYVMPKHEDKGYFVNELPYFIEGQKAMIVAQQSVTKFDDNNIVFIDLPSSEAKDNYRFVKGKININLHKKTALVDTKLTLSGQFSTLLRNFYKNRAYSELIDKNYYQKFYEWKKSTEIIENLPIEAQNSFPFKAEKNVKFKAHNIISAVNDSIYKLNITGCLQQVENKAFEQAKKRNYYFDFKMKDTYCYLLEFEQAVELLLEGMDELSFSQDADFGTYSTKIIQQSPTQILIESKLLIEKEKAEVSELSALRAIYKHIKNINQNTEIQVKLL